MHTCVHKLIVCKLFSSEDYLVSYASHVEGLYLGLLFNSLLLCNVYTCAYTCWRVWSGQLYTVAFFHLYMGARVEVTLGCPAGVFTLLSHLLPRLCSLKRTRSKELRLEVFVQVLNL